MVHVHASVLCMLATVCVFVCPGSQAVDCLSNIINNYASVGAPEAYGIRIVRISLKNFDKWQRATVLLI